MTTKTGLTSDLTLQKPFLFKKKLKHSEDSCKERTLQHLVIMKLAHRPVSSNTWIPPAICTYSVSCLVNREVFDRKLHFCVNFLKGVLNKKFNLDIPWMKIIDLKNWQYLFLPNKFIILIQLICKIKLYFILKWIKVNLKFPIKWSTVYSL